MSGVGKGITASSIGYILKLRGYLVTAMKIDPYVNVDAGTMNPTEHGEVFVLADGMECDQDMGNYERFLDCNLTRTNYMTTGSVYLSVINKERNLGYKGKFVSVVPHIPLEVISKIDAAMKENKADITIIEIGGTVGEYENILFLEAVKMLKIRHPEDVVLVLVSFLPAVGASNELKTKPTQHAVRALNSAGLHPDIIIARAKVPLDKKRREKLAFHCSLRENDVVSAPDVETIYEVPLNFEKDKMGENILKKLHLRPKQQEMEEWRNFVKRIKEATREVKIGIVGKYFGTGDFTLSDAYISVIEAVKHAAYFHKRKLELVWLDAEDYEETKTETYTENLKKLLDYDGIVVPGGFGSRGIDGIMNAIQFVRENKIPYFGLCYGLQLAVVEFARNKAHLKGAHTTEVNKETKFPVIDVMENQKKNIAESQLGGTMRLGSYPAVLLKGTIAYEAYNTDTIFERHRHRYEVNPVYIDKLKEEGMIFSGKSPDGKLMEIAELSKEIHPFFLGTQFHPELQSRPLHSHPLFAAFIKAACERSKK
ncbi:MAG: CTP synthase [Parcubacteria group bacterium Gr01-1014_48]|nr:MAG: CTP synthase [Parcubacteria group bacterium Gr01-1014_48]